MSTHQIEQLKWLYGSLAGICLAFFLTLLGSGQPLNSSTPLFLSSVGFGVCLPIFSVFTLVHIMFVEEQRSSKEVQLALSAKWVKALTQPSVLLFAITITLMIFHISYFLGLVFLVSGVLMLFALKTFRGALDEKP